MTTEGVLAGIATTSIALLGQGLDSTVQGIGSLIIVWRFTGAGSTRTGPDRQHPDADLRAGQEAAR